MYYYQASHVGGGPSTIHFQYNSPTIKGPIDGIYSLILINNASLLVYVWWIFI